VNSVLLQIDKVNAKASNIWARPMEMDTRKSARKKPIELI
jgi:hypothetical protein